MNCGQRLRRLALGPRNTREELRHGMARARLNTRIPGTPGGVSFPIVGASCPSPANASELSRGSAPSLRRTRGGRTTNSGVHARVPAVKAGRRPQVRTDTREDHAHLFARQIVGELAYRPRCEVVDIRDRTRVDDEPANKALVRSLHQVSPAPASTGR